MSIIQVWILVIFIYGQGGSSHPPSISHIEFFGKSACVYAAEVIAKTQAGHTFCFQKIKE